ncbi:helix-turn-helix transcriptional regulator [Fulvivirgaceae bacterium PWU20]|uniref:Helix-turn-helix transcriptional regulator n=1 Tax=Chryseosolibacter indicus TaxID=2782351 RepID=A0ABS5VN67_9BACT|nr:helix-turn-helix transcriptional regulator [Chryseosolibacter indicus]
MLPDSALVIAFRYRGKVNYINNNIQNELPSITISGIRKTDRHIKYTGGAANLLVVFKEAGAAAFFKEPLHELFQQTYSLDNFLNRSILAQLEEELSEAKNNMERVKLIETFLLSTLQGYNPDKLIFAALDKIHASKGVIRIKELADALCISNDAFEKRFRRVVGASPKQFSYIIRMKHVLQLLKHNHKFTDLALDSGYFDQSHFNKDFKSFTGQSPRAFLASPSFW